MEKKVPIRTCIACRKAMAKKELFRIVKSGEHIFLDKTGKANGRGAYVCADVECIKKIQKQKLLNKVFSCPVEEQTYREIEEAFLSDKQ